MNCPDEGILQSYVDSELTWEEKKYIDNHLENCAYCRERLRQISENNSIILNKLSLYKEFNDSLANIEIKPFKYKKKNSSDFIGKGVDLIMNRYKRVAAVALSAALITTCITVQPVRAAVSNALSIFRVDNVKSVQLSLDDLQQIANEIKDHQSEINMDKLGKVSVTGGQNELFSIDKARAITDFKPLFLPNIYNNDLTINSVSPGTINFNLNVDNVNDVLKNLGATELLPQDLNGRTFTVKLPRQLNLLYNINGKSYNIVETMTPEILAPPDVNVDEIYNSLVNLPVIPSDLQRQLKSIKNWKNTMYIPFVKSSMEEVDINGTKGYAADVASLGLNAKNSSSQNSAVLWYKDGVFYGIQGPGNREDLIKLAQSMR